MKAFTTLCRRLIPLAASAAMVATLVTTVAGCAARGPVVRTDYDRGVDFNAYHTFGYPEHVGTDRGGYATLVTAHFKAAIAREMEVRGFTYSASNPDLLVNFYSDTQDKTEIHSYPNAFVGTYFGHPRFGYFSGWPFYYDDIDVVNYKAGQFKIDVVDPKRQQTIWEASVEERLTDQAQDNPQPLIARLVADMFAKFPRGATQPAPN